MNLQFISAKNILPSGDQRQYMVLFILNDKPNEIHCGSFDGMSFFEGIDIMTGGFSRWLSKIAFNKLKHCCKKYHNREVSLWAVIPRTIRDIELNQQQTK